MEVIPWRREEVRGVGGWGGWGCTLFSRDRSALMLGWGYVQVGGWESSLGVWVVVEKGSRIPDLPRETGGGHDLWYRGVICGSLEHQGEDLSSVIS